MTASCFTITTLYDIKQGRPHVIESLVDSAARPNAAIVFDFLNTTCNIQQHIAFVNVAGTSQVVGSTQTRVNEEEVKVAYKLAQSLAAARVAENDITVITPYKGQVVLFKHYADQVKMARTSVVMWNVPNVACSTIDEFQGRENSVMIVSLVNHEAVGFMADPRRQGIAFSRARDDLIIIGNHESRKNPWSRKYIGRSFLCSGTKSAGHGPTGQLLNRQFCTAFQKMTADHQESSTKICYRFKRFATSILTMSTSRMT